MNFNENNSNQNWSELSATEKKDYAIFHKNSYEDDLRHSEKNLLEFPRWSIISGYYCMHDLTKLFLAEKFNIKISSPNIHSKTIFALEYFVKKDELKTRLLELLKEADELYYSAERLKEKTIPTLLKKGKQERGKAQYYSDENNKKIDSQRASYFLDTVVKPYVRIICELIKNAD